MPPREEPEVSNTHSTINTVKMKGQTYPPAAPVALLAPEPVEPASPGAMAFADEEKGLKRRGVEREIAVRSISIVLFGNGEVVG
jgi:hypothetical protein